MIESYQKSAGKIKPGVAGEFANGGEILPESRQCLNILAVSFVLIRGASVQRSVPARRYPIGQRLASTAIVNRLASQRDPLTN